MATSPLTILKRPLSTGWMAGTPQPGWSKAANSDPGPLSPDPSLYLAWSSESGPVASLPLLSLSFLISMAEGRMRRGSRCKVGARMQGSSTPCAPHMCGQ